jgi:diguanylate cyclase (GGDEF)-like protein
MRILVVEDDEFIAQALTMVLYEQNYAVEVACDGEAGWELAISFDYDLILLDVMLPKLDGISLCQRLRSHGYTMPILLITGRDSSHDKAIGLDAGADDYLVKPFDREELVARVRALLRRGSSNSLPTLEWGDLRLDPSSCEVTYGTQSLHLTPKEYALLELFLRNNRRVFSCSAILDHIWSFDKTPGEEAVRTQIKGLRQKLKAAGAAADLIETVYGIGYRLKPQAAQPVSLASPDPSEQTRQQTLSALAGVWERFKSRVSEQVAVLEQAAARQGTLDPDRRLQAERAAHSLAGSLGTFGFTEGSQLARKIEHSLLAGKLLNRDEARRLSELVEALRQVINITPEELVSATKTPKDERPLLLIVDGDRLLMEQLVTEAAAWGIQTEVATSLSVAREIITSKHPNVVLLDLDLNLTTADSMTLLAELSMQTPPLPVLVFTTQDNLTTRLEVARYGGRAFLLKPVPCAQVLQAVTQLLQDIDTSEAGVMVVDDDPQILATLRSLLEPWGLKVITLDDPRRFWETLEAFSPDLLILDINMPHVSGIELCQVVRQDANWGGLPVLFLTAHTDASIVNQVFAIGADDFVNKPIVGPELVTRIINRLERIKLFRNLAEIDPLTGVCNRHKSTQELDKFLRLAKRQSQPLCLAILDLDNFKQVNDRFGHATGDAVLRQMGQLLRQSFRSEDIVSRWGGEEFVLGLYGMNREDGVQRLTKVLETLRQEEFVAPNYTKFRVTFSAGVAQYPEDGADLQLLYKSADTALYQAKAAGRDRVSSIG